MPVVGTRKSSSEFAKGYAKDPMAGLASQFRDVAKNIVTESGFDVFDAPRSVMLNASTNEAMKNFFIENSADREGMSAEDYADHCDMMNEQYENDRSAVLEYSAMADFNPVIGMTFPLHKNILMNCMFDKGAIPKVVAREPKFTISLETRILTTPDGKEIDMFLNQNDMYDAIESTAPLKDTVIDLPENMTTDVLATTFNASGTDDHLSVESHISAVLVETWTEPGNTYYDTTTKANVVMPEGGTAAMKPAWFLVGEKRFTPGYGEFDRQLSASVKITRKTSKTETEVVEGYLSGYTKKNKFCITCTNAKVTKVKLTCRIDTSSAMIRTCSVSWRVRTDIVEIPNAIPINVPISPEEVKDIGALYQINQLTKIMSLFKTVLGNYKDDKILRKLNASFTTMPAANKLAETFDFAPRDSYLLDHVEWRHKTFMDALDTWVTQLLYVLNDPNMTITVIGNADLIRKITPTEYTYQSPSAIGPVVLDFQKTIVTSDRRVYNFISSDKLRDNTNLIVLLCPLNTERIIYRIYDYQMYVSNEIRNSVNYALPAIHAFERWHFVSYQPVQGRIKILNPRGLRDYTANDDPIGVNRMNNYTMNKPAGTVTEIPDKVDHVTPSGLF